MIAPSSPTAPAQGWTVAPASRGLASRLAAGFLHVSTGLVLAAAVLGLSVASDIISRGVVVAEPSDVATLRALSPVFALFGIVAAGHVLAGLGTVFGNRGAAALGIGLGAFDAVAGIVVLAIAATGEKGYVDAVNLAMVFIVMGIVLAVTARAADWNTHGPIAEA